MTNPAPPPVPKKHGCFFYGCIISLVLFLVIGVVGFLTVRYIANTMHEMVAQYTQSTPAVMPAVELPPEEMKQLQGRIEAFNSALKAHTPTPPLVLTSRDLNALIANDPEIKNKCYVTIESDKIKGQLSLPLDQLADVPVFRMLHLKGRYLNGAVTMRASIDGGKLAVYVESLEANGKPAPETFMGGFRQQNLAEGFNQGTNADIFANYESLEVTNSTIIVKAKGQ